MNERARRLKVLGLLTDRPHTAQELRAELGMWLVAFYWFMNRLEREGVITGWFEDIEIGGVECQRRWYRIATSPNAQEGGR